MSELSMLALLQRFMQLQEMRKGISNELQTAFDEEGITDAALGRVIEISSMGLLEVKAETEVIIDTLGSKGDSGKQEKKACEEVETYEKERIIEATRRQQIQRILKLAHGRQDDLEQDAREIEAALSQSDVKLRTILNSLNEALDEVRASIADLAAAEDD